jgi:Presenilin
MDPISQPSTTTSIPPPSQSQLTPISGPPGIVRNPLEGISNKNKNNVENLINPTINPTINTSIPIDSTITVNENEIISEQVIIDDEDDGYTLEHLSAVIRPVAVTMILASLAVGQIRDPQQDAALSQGLSSYLVYQESSNSGGGTSSGQQLGEALINALVIVCVICAATFVLVMCYYFRCIKLMIGYLIFASINLLGYSGGFLVISAIQVAQLPVDWITLAFIMYNFAIAGAIAVFWQKGIPRMVTQGYLIAVSVIMSWLVTKLPEVCLLS